MVSILIKADISKITKRIDEKVEALNTAIHDAGFMLEAEIKKDVASYPSVDTGRFMGSITTDISKQFQAMVFTNIGYAKYLEYGTSAHFVSPVTKKVLAWKGGTTWFFSKGHMVRGIKPRWHFRNTSMRMKDKIISLVEQRVAAVK